MKPKGNIILKDNKHVLDVIQATCASDEGIE